MQLAKFRIQNYKRIEESDWIEIDDVTAIIGGNETGKTSVLQALWKLKPGHENIVLDAQDEFPRRRYTTDYARGGEWPVVSAVFDIDDELREALVAIDPAFKACQQVECTSHYDQEHLIAFLPSVDLSGLSSNEAQKLVRRVADLVKETQPEGLEEEAVEAFKEAISDLANQTLEHIRAQSDAETPADLLDSFRGQLDILSRGEWQRASWAAAAEDIERALNRAGVEERFQKAIDLAWEAVPVFIYFDDYHLLESEVYIPDALQRIAAGSSDPVVRSQWALFERAGFPIREIAGLSFRPDPNQPVDEQSLDTLFGQIRERAIIASSAGRIITDEFSNWWHQQRHEIEFRVDGETFQIWVADEKYPVLIEFEQRSHGFRWFFSFYLIFSVETDYAHKNAVLLLDEPGLHLYPPAQQELLGLFGELAQNNQVIYTTHSPFLIDNQQLDNVRVVEETEDGLVRISNEAAQSSNEATFPIRANLSYQLAQMLSEAAAEYVEKENLEIDEANPTDWLLNLWTADEALPSRVLESAEEMFRAIYEADEEVPDPE